MQPLNQRQMLADFLLITNKLINHNFWPLVIVTERSLVKVKTSIETIIGATYVNDECIDRL